VGLDFLPVHSPSGVYKGLESKKKIPTGLESKTASGVSLEKEAELPKTPHGILNYVVNL